MKKSIFTRFAAAALVLAAVSCQNEEMLDTGQNGASVELVPFTVTATFETEPTKTSLQEDGKVFWENGDAMNILAVAEDGAVTSYKFTTTDEGAEAKFDGDVALAKNYYAVYPYTDKGRLGYLHDARAASWQTTVKDSKLKVYFPSMQKVYASGAKHMDAYSVGVVADDGSVAMKNLGGLIKINIPVEGVEHVILYGNAGESIVGNAYVTFDEEGLPVVSSVDGSNMVRIVPATGSTFAIGEYYINVLPVTFAGGLSVIFTKSDHTWASVRSSGEFVVERSKISPLPTVHDLNFNGLVVDLVSVTDAGAETMPLSTSLPKSNASDVKGVEKTYKRKVPGNTSQTDYEFKFCGTLRHYRASELGWVYGKGVNDYIEVPGIEGYSLNKVVVRNSAEMTSCGNPTIQNVDKSNVYGCSIWEGVKAYGIEHIWSFAGNIATPYRVARTSSENLYTSFHQIRLYYSPVVDGESSIKPLIASVITAEPETNPANGKATLKGSFAAVDCTQSAVSCGFEYKKVSEDEWTSVTCPQATSEFSCEFTQDSDEDYVYRAWAKVNTSSKTVYGEEVQFNARKLVLSLVFDENRYETGYNYAWDTWKIGTNTNTADENPNGATYNYTLDGVDYPFTLWSYRPEPTVGGYAIWATSGSKKVYGLSLSYTKDLADSQPAWMQMPGPANFRLIEVNATLYENFAGTISASVNEDGTAAGNPLASFSNRKHFPLALTGTAPGTRYYFCTTANTRPTLKNLTLTYLYVGE